MFKQRWPCYLGFGLFIGFGIWWWFFCGTQTMILLVRHADRVGENESLSASGVVRAQELVHVAEKSGINAIIRSDALRAEQTAQPIAAALGLTPIVFPGSDVQAFADEIRTHHRGQKVLVVGHSNSVPQIITALGGPSLPTIGDAEFDNLFVLSLCRCSRRGPVLTNLQYGVPSP